MDSLVLEITTIFDWLTKTTLHASVIVLIVIAVRFMLSKRLAPRWHYYLWLLVIARMLMPIAPQSAFSIFNLIGAVTEQSTPAEPEPVIAQVPQTTPEAAAIETNYSPLPPVETVAATEHAPAAPLAIEPIAAAADPVEPEPIDYIALLPLVWLAGVFALAAYVLLGNIRLSRIVTQQRPVTDSDILNLLEDCKSQMNLHTYLSVVETSKVSSPALFGFIRPRLLLPEGLLEKLTPAQLRHVFLHELAHLKRGDIYFGWLVALLQTIHWFNPLVWLAFHKMRADRELACDQLALTSIQNEEPNEYGKTIVSLLENFSTSSYNPGLAGILEDRSQLKRRITMIAKHKKGSYRFSMLAAIVIAILCAVALTSAKDTTTLDEKKASANAFADLLIKGQFKEAVKNFDRTMKKTLPARKLGKTWKESTANAGPFEKKLGTRSDKYLWSDIIYVTCQFQQGPMDIKVVYDRNNKISGLWLVPVPQKVLQEYSNNNETTDGPNSSEVIVVGKLNVPVGESGTVIAEHGASFYGNEILYTPKLYRGGSKKGAAIVLMDTIVIKNKYNIPIIKVKVQAKSGTVEAGSIAWIQLKTTSFADHFIPGVTQNASDTVNSTTEYSNNNETTDESYSSEIIVVGKLNVPVGESGTVIAEHGAPFYGNKTLYTPKLYRGRLRNGAAIILMDTIVINNEYNIPIIKVKVQAKSGTAEAGSIAWIQLKTTSFANHFIPEETQKEKTKGSDTSTSLTSVKHFPCIARPVSENVSIRSGGGDAYYDCGKLKAGVDVTVVGEEFGWAKILPPSGSFSWIAKKYIDKEPSNPNVGIVKADGVRVWAGSPALKALNSSTTQIKLSKSNSDVVELLGEEDNNYLKISPPSGAFLYVPAKQLKYTGPVEKQSKESATSNSTFTATLTNGLKVELLGVYDFNDSSRCWRPDGQLLDKMLPFHDQENKYACTDDQTGYEFLVRITKQKESDKINARIVTVPKGNVFSACMGGGNNLWAHWMVLDKDLTHCDLEVEVTGDTWVTAATTEPGSKSLTMNNVDGFNDFIMLSPLAETDGRTVISFSHSITDSEVRIIVIDTDGKEHTNPFQQDRPGTFSRHFKDGTFTTYLFDLPLNQVKTVKLQTRKYSKVTFKNVSLKPMTINDSDAFISHRPQSLFGDFYGKWVGTAIDKPEDGSSDYKLELFIDNIMSGLPRIVTGDFVKDGRCVARDVKIDGNGISLEVDHAIEGLRMKLNLKLVDGKLIGEAIPVNMDEDRCDIVLERAQEKTKVTDTLSPPQVKNITGTVRDESGNPVAGALVLPMPHGGYPFETDSNGGFVIPGPTEKRRIEHLLARDMENNLATLTEIKDYRNTQDVILTKAIKLTGRVIDTDGKPVQNAEVDITIRNHNDWSAGFGYTYFWSTDKRGYFNVRSLPVGLSYDIHIKAKGYATKTKALGVLKKSGQIKISDIVLVKSPTLKTGFPKIPTGKENGNTLPMAKGNVAHLEKGITVELASIRKHIGQDRQPWKIDGTKMDGPLYKTTGSVLKSQEGYTHYEFAARIMAPSALSIKWDVPDGRNGSYTGNPLDDNGNRIGDIYVYTVNAKDTDTSATVNIGVSSKPWQTRATHTTDKNEQIYDTEIAAVAFGRPYEKDSVTMLPFMKTLKTETPYATRVIAMTNTGREVVGGVSGNGSNSIHSSTYYFKTPLADIKEFRFQSRLYEFVRFENVSLRPGGITEPKITIEQPESNTGNILDTSKMSASERRQYLIEQARRKRSKARSESNTGNIVDTSKMSAGERRKYLIDQGQARPSANAARESSMLKELAEGSLHRIEVDTTKDFLTDDSIEITELYGSNDKLKSGNTYLVKGRYNLASKDTASLMLYATNGETNCKQSGLVHKGQGEFTRAFYYAQDGYLHLSFYPAEGGSSFGNLYFNHKGGYVPDISKIKGGKPTEKEHK